MRYRMMIAALLLPLTAKAASMEEVMKCKDIKDHAVRLDCYDTAVSEPAEPKASGNAISWKDLQLDYRQMRGKIVTTSGTFMMLGEQGLLYDEQIGTTAFFVDIKRLSRDDRRTILDNCATGCPLEVTGKVADVMMNPGIIARSVNLP